MHRFLVELLHVQLMVGQKPDIDTQVRCHEDGL